MGPYVRRLSGKESLYLKLFEYIQSLDRQYSSSLYKKTFTLLKHIDDQAETRIVGEKVSTQNNGPGINIYRWSMVHLYLNSHMTLGSLKKRWGKQSNRTIWKLDGEYIYKCWDFKTKGRNKIQNKEVESFMGGAK